MKPRHAVVASALIGVMAILFSSVSNGIAVDAQRTTKVWRLGLFHVGLDHVPPSLHSLKARLKELGYEEGKNIHYDWRNLPDEAAAHETAKAFVRDKVDLLVPFENQSIRAAKAATTEIPIVFLHANDPESAGIVTSLSHPGGNLTGFAAFFFELPDKKLELFKQMVPRLRRVLVLHDAQDPLTPRLLARVRQASALLDIGLVEQAVSDEASIKRVFGAMPDGDVEGIFVLSPTLQVKFSSLLIRLAADKALPIPGYREAWVKKGALFSYAPDIRIIGREAATYVDKVLKGAKPSDLPVVRSTQLNLVINLKTAEQLGITIPPDVLYQTTKVIR